MARSDRKKSFNAAFAALKKRPPAPPKAAPGPPAAAAGRRGSGPTAGTAAATRGTGGDAEAAGDTTDTTDAALFAAAMRDATPLAAPVARVPEPQRVVPKRPSDDEYALAELVALVEGSSPFRTHASEEEFFGAAPGVNNALLEGLRRGQYAFQLCLDLHGMVRDEAHQQVIRFIIQARCREGATCVLIVTGRGRSSPDGSSVLRDTLPRWLSRAPVRPHVLAYATARPVDGGPGAYYVLLRRQGVRPFGSPP